MLKEYLQLNVLFIIGLILQVSIAIFFEGSLFIVIQLILLISLILFFVFKTKLKGRFHKRMVYALLVSFIGLLYGFYMSFSEIYWPYLVIIQVISYFLFTRTFYLDFRSAQELDKKGAKIAILTTAFLSVSSYFYLRPYLGKLQVLVLLLTLLISFMMMMAAFRNKRVNSFSFVTILIGAYFLGLSNGLLAYDLFVSSSRVSEILIGVIFSMAMYLMVLGGVSRRLITVNSDPLH
jgi:hypothetical protein